MRVIILTLIFYVFMQSCRNSPSVSITGTWKLDSTIHNNKRKMPASAYLKIKFDKKVSFNYLYMQDDVINEYQGKFYLKDSAKSLKSLILVSDTLHYGTKSFQKYFHYVLLELNDNRFTASKEEVYTLLNGSLARHKTTDIFKKID